MMKRDNTMIDRLEESIFRSMTQTSVKWYLWVGLLVVLMIWGFYAYSVQLRRGLAVTGMGDEVIWGFYIINFVFFIGISHAGTLISAILRVTQAEWRRPITRMAEVITVVALMVGALMPIIDMGRPDRLLNMIFNASMSSPLMWDVISITTYLTGSLIYLYLPLIPDIARCRDHLQGSVARWRWRLYAILALGWRATPGQRRKLERATAIMMILIIPIAVSVHTVVSWIFGMTLRPGWHSTVFGPYFVVGAIFSGIAGIITVMYIFRRVYRLEEYITEKHFRYLGYLLLTMGLLYIYFTIAEYLTIGYKLELKDKLLLEALMFGDYAVPFWGFVIVGTLLPTLLIILPSTRTIPGIVVASVLVNVGMWLKRFVIVIPSLALPLMPYEWGVYQPTWVEISISVAAVAAFALVFTLFAKFFPIISVWEMEEGEERAAAVAPTWAPSAGTVTLAPQGGSPAALPVDWRSDS
jgi:Ni/Fe-hydrogenase subunit HybB-like protein